MHARLRRGWSPEEVAGSLRRDHPELTARRTSHESIYRYVYVVARGELQRALIASPRRRGVLAAQGRLKDMVLVDKRPPEVESRLIPGHYEGDLIRGAGNRSAVGVLVERTTRYTFRCHLPQQDATSVREAFARKLAALPGALRKSLTYDQGKEMAEPARLSPPTSSSKSSSATPTVPGNAPPAKARTIASGIICPRAPTCLWFLINSSARTKRCSTSAHAKYSTGSPPPNASMNSL